jgi:hypothetical protein
MLATCPAHLFNLDLTFVIFRGCTVYKLV